MCLWWPVFPVRQPPYKNARRVGGDTSENLQRLKADYRCRRLPEYRRSARHLTAGMWKGASYPYEIGTQVEHSGYGASRLRAAIRSLPAKRSRVRGRELARNVGAARYYTKVWTVHTGNLMA
jgi:hypothetical protein